MEVQLQISAPAGLGDRTKADMSHAQFEPSGLQKLLQFVLWCIVSDTCHEQENVKATFLDGYIS